MALVLICGERCRPGILLAAIGAQEALEQHSTSYARSKLAGPTAIRGFERDRMRRASRRNSAERKLRDHERRVWERWRSSPEAEREAIKAALSDPPGWCER